ncbi:hypothetical protein GOP47_0028609 [Adiantum capillus-veneris]|nr:hypothetical protein GOP47_0028609 [Adiantum capillus-veneris]
MRCQLEPLHWCAYWQYLMLLDSADRTETVSHCLFYGVCPIPFEFISALCRDLDSARANSENWA